MQLPHVDIARKIKVTPKTLYRYYREELADGQTIGKAKILSAYWAAVERGEAWAISFGLRFLCGYQEKPGVQQIQQLGANGQPVNPPGGVTYIIKDDERRAIEKQGDELV